MLFGLFTIYNKNVMQADERANKLREIEERYLVANPENMIKLQNFKQRIFAIGMVDDLGTPDRESEEHKKAISKNSAMIRDFCREMSPEQVVLELCEERYQDELQDIISHVNYDRTMTNVHKLLSQKKPSRLLRFEDQISVNHGNFEYLVGLDTCSYRLPCKTVLGDRNLSTTQKRYQAKVHLMDLYKEQINKMGSSDALASSNATIKSFDKASSAAATKDTTPAAVVQKKKVAKTSSSTSKGSIFDL